jgi:transcriptional regulator with XRE-family HTH domain
LNVGVTSSSTSVDEYSELARLGALKIARSVELRQRRNEMLSGNGPAETSGMELLGIYLRRSRLLAEMTQQQLAVAAGVSQSTVSRAERGVAPKTTVAQLIRVSRPLGRIFPFGVCPHDHRCAWQPAKIEEVMTEPRRYIEYMLGIAGEQ